MDSSYSHSILISFISSELTGVTRARMFLLAEDIKAQCCRNGNYKSAKAMTIQWSNAGRYLIGT